MAEKEYIEAKDLDDFRNDIMDKFLSLCNYNDYNKLTLLRIGETIDDAYYKYVSKPLADVVEVRHGTWYHGTEYGAVYAKCSACGRKMNYSCYGYAYCALCGARMDGTPKERGGSDGNL